jgi:hypothetical protein
MKGLLEKDLPHGLHQLLYFWQGEEMDPEVREKVCDEEISEEEEVKMFLEYCVKEYRQGRKFSEEEKTFLEKNGYSLT